MDKSTNRKQKSDTQIAQQSYFRLQTIKKYKDCCKSEDILTRYFFGLHIFWHLYHFQLKVAFTCILLTARNGLLILATTEKRNK